MWRLAMLMWIKLPQRLLFSDALMSQEGAAGLF
jgi:hypothetical protein